MPTSSPTPKPSALLVTIALALLAASVPLFVTARSAAETFDVASAQVATVYGWLFAGPGLVLLLAGVHRLARNVDIAAGVGRDGSQDASAPVATERASVD